MKVQYIVFVLSGVIFRNLWVKADCYTACHSCDSAQDSRCTDWNPAPEVLKRKICTLSEEKCNDGYSYVTCGKNIVTRTLDNGTQTESVVRGCLYGDRYVSGCRGGSNDRMHLHWKECVCWGEFCNGAASNHLPYALIALCALVSSLVAYVTN